MSEANLLLIPFSNKKPEVPPHGVLVARRKDGRFVPLWSGRLSAGELLFNPYDGYVVVDKRLMVLAFALELPSATEPLCFTAQIDLQVRVADPVEVLASGITDVRALLQSKLQKVLKGVAASIGIEDRRRAEQECQGVLDKLKMQGGLELVEACVGITVDAQTREDLVKERRIQNNEKDFNAGRQRMVARMLAENPKALADMLKSDEQRPFLEMSQLLEVVKELKDRKILEDWEAQKYVQRWFEQNSKQLVGKSVQGAHLIGAGASAPPQTLAALEDGEQPQGEE